MERATPVQMRKSLELVQQLQLTGIRFVPIPVMNNDEYLECMAKLNAKIDEILQIAEQEESEFAEAERQIQTGGF